ncbi:hypothetical protein [Rhodovarius crocodyli]|uniref:hypothetical protein n=1 Tax=Rhodovarius crocodyli TaxID=1979269 RepID=UPI0013E2BAFC|nr:hypothetical protein [Rhodovarius crocodyli]
MSRSKFVGTRIEETTLDALDKAARQVGCNKAQLMNIILVRWLTARGYLAEEGQEVLP